MKTRLVLVGMVLGVFLGCRTTGTDDSTSSSSGGNTSADGGNNVRRDAGPRTDAGVEEPDAGGTGRDAGPRPDAHVTPQPVVRESLRWRTGMALERHLMQALALTEDEVCAELGRFKCITRPVAERPFRPSGTAGNPTVGLPIPHLVALGGNEPFDLQMYEPRKFPGATTPSALDRVVLAACDARVEKDKVGPAVVFTGVDLNAATVASLPALRTVAGDLFQRFHLRDATTAELDLVMTLAAAGSDGVVPTAADAALAVCVAIGGMSESSFD